MTENSQIEYFEENYKFINDIIYSTKGVIVKKDSYQFSKKLEEYY